MVRTMHKLRWVKREFKRTYPGESTGGVLSDDDCMMVLQEYVEVDSGFNATGLPWSKCEWRDVPIVDEET